MPAPVIMVHGAFCGGWAFDAFRAPFETMGHGCIAADLPGHDDEGRVAGLSMSDYAAAVVDQIDTCGEPPILIGHSLGGLVAQLAAARRAVHSLILLAPSSPWGVSSMEGAAAAIGLMSLGAYWAGAVEPDRGLAHAFGLDGLPADTREAAFARMVPESGRALGETFHWWLDPFMTTRVSDIRAPVLALAGGRDRIHPPSAVRQTAARLGGDVRVYEAMGHWLVGEPGWEAPAADCLRWLQSGFSLAA